MDFGLTEEQSAISSFAEDLFRDHGDDDRIRALYEGGDPFDGELWKNAAEGGLLGLAVPEALGGTGLASVELSLVLQQQGRVLAPIPLWRHHLAALAVATFGAEELRSDTLPRLLDGALVASFSADLGQAATITATRAGNGWQLSGVLHAVPLPRNAGLLVAPVTVDGEVTLFAVDLGSAGITRTEGVLTHYEAAADLVFDDVMAQPAARLPCADVERWLAPRSALASSSLQLGATSEALRRAAAYVSEREQFGRPIGSFQAVAQRMADAYTQVELLRVAVQSLAWYIDSDRDALRAGRVAKLQASEAGHIVGHTALHYHGGIGADLTYPVHRFFLWNSALDIMDGSSEAQLAALVGDGLPATVGAEL